MTIAESLLIVVRSDRTAHEHLLALAAESRDDLDRIAAESEVFTRDEAQRFWLADAMKDYIETICDDAGAGLAEPASLIVMQLFRDAFERVDWKEVADDYLTTLAECK